MLYAHEVKTNQFIYQSMDPKDFLDTVTEKAKQANAKRLYVVGVDFEATQVIKKYLESQLARWSANIHGHLHSNQLEKNGKCESE